MRNCIPNYIALCVASFVKSNLDKNAYAIVLSYQTLSKQFSETLKTFTIFFI